MAGADRKPIRAHEAEAIIQAMRSGVVPPIGLHHIQVGRVREIDSFIRDIERIQKGGSMVRFVIGEYGAGKTFFLNTVRLISLEKKLVVLKADLTPERRLYSTSGHAQSLYTEMIKNMSTRSRMNGGAVQSLVERYIFDKKREAEESGEDLKSLLYEDAESLQDFIAGYDFSKVIMMYAKADEEGDNELKTSAIRWLRGEYSMRTKARFDLGVTSIVDDMNFYDYIKLWSKFSRLCGYKGLIVCLDEMVNLYKLSKKKSRYSNYEQILRIINDVLQGTCGHIGFVMAGTPEFLMDTRRGLYSYEALQTRLATNAFVKDKLVDMNGPVLHLENLSPEDLFVLLKNIRSVYSLGDESKFFVTDSQIENFMTYCRSRIGDAYFHTPRSTVKAFINFLSVLEQNEDATPENVLGNNEIDPGDKDDGLNVQEDDELISFKL